MKRNYFQGAGALATALLLVTGAASAQTPAVAPAISDTSIIASLIAANQKEVAAANDAIAQASSNRVKDFAQRLQRDHQKMTEELQEYQQKLGGVGSGVVDTTKPATEPIADTTAKQQVPPAYPDSTKPADTTYANQQTRTQPVTQQQPVTEVPPYTGRTGKEFDQAWVGHMVTEHQATVRNLRENVIPQIKDSGLKNLVQGFLPIIGNHLRDAQALQAQLK